jgi:predicted AAA+ superfamily ATPase
LKKLIQRTIDLNKLLNKKSFFLFGPRSTGKSTIVAQQLSTAVKINLLNSAYLLRLSAAPHELEEIAESHGKLSPESIVVIDEIQKVPELLNEVHRLIEEKNLRFLLTGSSARKLKASGVNLLAGRAWIAGLFPLTIEELGEKFDLERMLLYGGLPQVYFSEDPVEELAAYITTYINEEIKQEGLVRKIPSFLSFLKLAAQTNGQMINFATISSDVGIAATTVSDYYRILEDTLIGKMLESWHESKKRKAITTAKFYFFDTGVVNRINDIRALERNSDLYGRAFEHWIFMELSAYLSYTRSLEKLRYWRSVNKHEVDFLIGDSIAIEVKSTRKIHKSDLKNLRTLNEEGVFKKFYLVTHDPVEALRDGVFCLHWKTFMARLWGNQLMDGDLL